MKTLKPLPASKLLALPAYVEISKEAVLDPTMLLAGVLRGCCDIVLSSEVIRPLVLPVSDTETTLLL